MSFVSFKPNFIQIRTGQVKTFFSFDLTWNVSIIINNNNNDSKKIYTPIARKRGLCVKITLEKLICFDWTICASYFICMYNLYTSGFSISFLQEWTYETRFPLTWLERITWLFLVFQVTIHNFPGYSSPKRDEYSRRKGNIRKSSHS